MVTFMILITDNNKKKIYVDAKDLNYSNWTRFVNGAKTYEEYDMINIKAEKFANKIFYIATKDINPGEELIMSYGQYYW